MSHFPEEPLDSPSGYFPGRLNQTLNNGCWTILRKLGWGSHSSCWLAVDSKNLDNIEAIKIYTAAATKEPRSTNERDILQTLWDFQIISSVPVQRNNFYEESEVGRHLCLVHHTLGPSILSFLDNDTPQGSYLPLHIAKNAIGEVVEVLCSLHEKGIIHGAVTPDHILLSASQQGPDIRNYLSKNPSIPGEDVKDGQGKLHHIIKSQPLTTSGLSRQSTAADFANFGMYLINYSHARILSDNVPLDAPSAFLPPESSVNGAKINARADIWMLGCTIYTLSIGHPPFESSSGPLTLEKVEEVVDGAETAIAATNAMSAEDAKKTALIIKACLKYKSEERPTALDLIGYKWVAEGLMCSCGWCSSRSNSS
ncbi:kinase-like domain-containing protein [Gymnopilus junonius]|uniref:non-specific serine/threonine protein kinase n=1 Tax=Gymnopilus junonius TaxID=109634 RepID=A0A9P5TJ45_GYMJU|nr:kinase-like domain-containing protein [Gymnopilus junonius]